MEAVPIASQVDPVPDGTATPSLSAAPFDTTEVRWFAAGLMPRRLVEWFTMSGRRGTLEVRYDAYLAGNSPGIGRKYRNHGPFETKTRQTIGDPVELDGRLRGRTEDWRKVAMAPPAVPPAPDGWCDVHKVVLTRTYHEAAPDQVVEVAYGDLAAAGCDIELAAVTVRNIEAWTFALETWGPAETRRNLLERCAAAFIASTGLPDSLTSALTEDIGYPQWLARTVWHSGARPATGF
jgi:hypothetical protein